MITLDIATLNFIPIVLVPLYLSLLWLMSKVAASSNEGIIEWFWGIAFVSVGINLRSYLQFIPSVVTIDLSNLLVLSGILLLVRGFYQYAGDKFPLKLYLPVLSVTMTLILLFNHFYDSVAARIVAHNILVIIAMTDILRVLFTGSRRASIRVRWFAAAPVLFFLIISLVRLVSVMKFVLNTNFTEISSVTVQWFYLLVVFVLTLSVVSYAILIAERMGSLLELKVIQLNEEQRSRDLFYGLLAHELAGPMKGMVNLLDVMRDPNIQFKENAARLLDMAHETARSTHDLLRKLLLWTGIQGGRKIFNAAEVDLGREIALSLSYLSFQISERSITVKTHVSEGFIVLVDPDLLSFVLRNLVSNAVKFSPIGSTIVIRAERDGAMAMCSVADNGQGMNDQLIAEIMSGNGLSPDREKINESGYGLGLTMCRDMLESVGSGLTIKSTPGSGTEIIFRLQVAGPGSNE